MVAPFQYKVDRVTFTSFNPKFVSPGGFCAVQSFCDQLYVVELAELVPRQRVVDNISAIGFQPRRTAQPYELRWLIVNSKETFLMSTLNHMSINQKSLRHIIPIETLEDRPVPVAMLPKPYKMCSRLVITSH